MRYTVTLQDLEPNIKKHFNKNLFESHSMNWMVKMHTFSSGKRFFLQKSFKIVGTHIVKASGIIYVCLDSSPFID